MSARVMLFVSEDIGAPAGLVWSTPLCAWSGKHDPRDDGSEWCRIYPSERARWWLVECENADAGRRLIAFKTHEGAHWYGAVVDGPDSFKIDSTRPCSCGHVLGSDIPGRLLASGGKP